MEYKFVELLSCNFIASPEDVIRAHICFRYNTLKSRLALVQARLQDIESLIKVCVSVRARAYGAYRALRQWVLCAALDLVGAGVAIRGRARAFACSQRCICLQSLQ